MYPGIRRKALSTDQAVFNWRLSRAGGVIENTRGILVARWRLFRKPIHAEKVNVTCFPVPAVSLHNYLQQTEKSSYYPKGFIDSDASGNFRPGEW